MEQLEKRIRELVPSLGKEEDYFEHRIGSHSDDYGGESDNPCYCNKPKEIQLHHVLQAIDSKYKKTRQAKHPVELFFGVTGDLVIKSGIPENNENGLVIWELDEDLNGQSQETVDFLLEILK